MQFCPNYIQAFSPTFWYSLEHPVYKKIQFLFCDSFFGLAFTQNKRKVEITNHTTLLLCTEVTNFMTAVQFKAWTNTHTFNAFNFGEMWIIPVNEFHYIKFETFNSHWLLKECFWDWQQYIYKTQVDGEICNKCKSGGSDILHNWLL
jgi:hypothetical protein